MTNYGGRLFPHHQKLLEDSAISIDVAEARGYVTVDTKLRLGDLGFANYQQLVPGLLIPAHSIGSKEIAGYQYRPDNPRTNKDGRSIKYESPPGTTPILDVNPLARRWIRGDAELWITEGARKADALTSLGLPAISLAGVAAWLHHGVALGDWSDVRLRGRDVVVAFDSDVMTKRAVRGQLDALTNYISAKGARVRRCYLPNDVDGKTGVDDHIAAGASLADLRELVVTEQTPQPVPLTRVQALPTFPTNHLPPWLASQTAAVAEFTQTPPDLPGVIALGVVAACAGGRAKVEVRDGWREPVNLFVAVAMAPGSRKSAVFSAMTKPLLDVEHEMSESTNSIRIEADTQRKIAERSAEASKQAAGRAEGSERDRLTAEAVDAAKLAEAIVVPELPRIFADNVTPEAATSLLAQQGGRLAILSAEGGIFDILAGRYSSGQPDLDVFLKGHAGDDLRVDRKGRPAEYVRSPALTMALAVQPAVLSTIGRNSTFGGRGLPQRFLFALPPNNVGTRRIGTPSVPMTVSDAYATNITQLAKTLAGWEDPAILTLTPEAAELLLDLERRLEPRLAPNGDLGGIAEWASKLAGATARIAGLIHLATDPETAWRMPIAAEEMAAALALADYFTAHALAAFEQMGADASLDAARSILDHLRRHCVDTFTVRSLFSALPRTKFARVPDLMEALDVLESHGWVIHLPTPRRDGPGRKGSDSYSVHPVALSAQSAEPSPESADDRDAA